MASRTLAEAVAEAKQILDAELTEERETCEGSLIEFMIRAWPEVEPGELDVNWHHREIAAALEADGSVDPMIGAIEPAQVAEIVNRVLQDFQPQDHGAVSPLGRVPSAAETNARVAAEPLLMSARVKAPLAMASSTQVRPAAWKARRHNGRQNFCCFPPSCRGRKDRSHQAQRTASLIAARGKLSR